MALIVQTCIAAHSIDTDKSSTYTYYLEFSSNPVLLTTFFKKRPNVTRVSLPCCISTTSHCSWQPNLHVVIFKRGLVFADIPTNAEEMIAITLAVIDDNRCQKLKHTERH